MCGFFVFPTILNLDASSSLRKRGPDEINTTELGGMTLQSYRLSIVGDYFGSQPLRYKDFFMVFNGEIYNYKELASAYNLSEAAHKSDGQCLLELLVTLSPSNAMPKIIGHYAFVLVDQNLGLITFARDHMGVKPLYFRNSEEGISVCSDIQTLAGAWLSKITADAALEALIFGGHSGEETLYADVFSSIPGVIYEVNRKNSTLSRLKAPLPKVNRPIDTEELLEIINNSVLEQAQVLGPSACLVSSGIDSRIIKELLPSDRSIYCVNALSKELDFSAEDINNDPDTIRLSLSASMGIEHFQSWLLAYGTVPAHNNFFALCMLYKELAYRDDLNYPSRIKVALTGEGADEYFGGYGRYKQLAKWLSGSDVPWIDSLRDISSSWMYLMNARIHHSSLQWLSNHGVNCDEVTQKHVAKTSCDPSSDASLDALSRYDIETNLQYGLQKQDIAGMMSSIEVRVPFVTQQIHQFSLSGIMAAADPNLSKLQLQKVAEKLNIVQPNKIGFPASLRRFVPALYQPSLELRKMLPFSGFADIPEDIRQGLYMLDVLNRSIEVKDL
jgi:asparagine synthase (glutamine-hydrolysing)